MQTNSVSQKLKPRQWAAVQLIAQGHTRAQVSEAVKVDPATLSRWRKDSVFQHALCTAVDDLNREAMEHLGAARALAIDRLTALISSTNERVALRAADLVLGRCTLAGMDSQSNVERMASSAQKQRSATSIDRLLDELLTDCGV